MKLGKIYDYRNKEEARKLIGKRVLATDVLYRLENPTENPRIGILNGFSEEKELPFNVELPIVGYGLYQFIREIEEDKPILMTNRQLSEWLARGFGERVLDGEAFKCEVSHSLYDYFVEEGNKPIKRDILIRHWGSDEWVKPTVDIYERDCKSYCRTTLA